MGIIESEADKCEIFPAIIGQYIEQRLKEGFVVDGVYRSDTQMIEYNARLIDLKKEHAFELGQYEIVEDADLNGQSDKETGGTHPIYYKILKKVK